VIRLTTAVAGHGEFGVKLAAPLAHALTGLLVFLIGGRLFGSRVGFWAGLLFITMPAVSYSSMLITTDPLLLMFWAASLYAVVRALESDTMSWWTVSGAALGCALLSKYTAIALPISVGLFLATSGRHRAQLKRPGAYVALLIACALIVPNLAWNARFGFITFRHVGETADIGGRLLHLDRLAEFLASQLGVFGPITFTVLLVLLFRWRRWIADNRMALLMWCVAPLLAAMSLQALLSFANANWAGPIYVSASVAVAYSLLEASRMRLLVASLVIHLAIGAALYAYEPIRLAFGAELPARYDLLEDVRGWPEVGRRVAELRARFPGTPMLFEYRMVLAECLYYGGLPLDEAFTWNPSGEIRNHYDLVSDLNTVVGRDLLFVSRSPSVDVLRSSFDEIVPLETIEVPTHSDASRVLYVSLVIGFRGYEDGPGR
jgi:4-amino-4-deoxy-L-arabinose transferase-like glycosyltransferase